MSGRSCTRCHAIAITLAAAAGALFGAGLIVSGMTQPARVIGFLDLLGGWDPSLAFVMAGAVAVYALAYRRIRRRSDPWFDTRFHVPNRRDIDRHLVLGAALFGIGWGLAGLCPGPALVSAGSASTGALIFVAAMIAGMYLHHDVVQMLYGAAPRAGLPEAPAPSAGARPILTKSEKDPNELVRNPDHLPSPRGGA